MGAPLPRRLRAELLVIRDDRAARLIERLCRKLEAMEAELAGLRKDLFQAQLSIRCVCAAARLPPSSIDNVDGGPAPRRAIR